MERIHQLLQKKLSLLPKELIFIDLDWDPEFIQTCLKQKKSIYFVFSRYNLYQLYKKQYPQQTYLLTDIPKHLNIDAIIIRMTKYKEKCLWLSLFLSQYNKNIYYIGENDIGIKSIDKLLSHYCQNHIQKIAIGAKCQLYFAQIRDNYTYHINDWFQINDIHINDTQFRLHSLPGVFNKGMLDKGTELLLSHWQFPIEKQHQVLDLGCANGIISAFLHHLYPTAQYHLIDIDIGAILSAKKNFTHCDNIQIYFSDGFSQIKQQFDMIVSNPPFHQEKKNTIHETIQLLQNTKKYLKKNGELIIVINRHLPYIAPLKKVFHSVKCHYENNHYKVLHCQ